MGSAEGLDTVVGSVAPEVCVLEPVAGGVAVVPLAVAAEGSVATAPPGVVPSTGSSAGGAVWSVEIEAPCAPAGSVAGTVVVTACVTGALGSAGASPAVVAAGCVEAALDVTVVSVDDPTAAVGGAETGVTAGPVISGVVEGVAGGGVVVCAEVFVEPVVEEVESVVEGVGVVVVGGTTVTLGVTTTVGCAPPLSVVPDAGAAVCAAGASGIGSGSVLGAEIEDAATPIVSS